MRSRAPTQPDINHVANLSPAVPRGFFLGSRPSFWAVSPTRPARLCMRTCLIRPLLVRPNEGSRCFSSGGALILAARDSPGSLFQAAHRRAAQGHCGHRRRGVTCGGGFGHHLCPTFSPSLPVGAFFLASPGAHARGL